MKKLSLDEINFVRKKIQQFIILPVSPRKTPIKSKNQDAPQIKSSRRKSKLPRSKSSKSRTLSKEQSQAWLKKKQSELLKFIIRQNREKTSVLNEYLNSDTIHLRKREEIQPGYREKQKQDQKKQYNQQQNHKHEQLNESKSFSFDHNFSSLKKAYKNIQSFLALEQVQENKQSSPLNQNPLFSFVKNTKNVPEQEDKKQTFNIDTETGIVKPSAMKGKVSFYTPPIQKQKSFTQLKKTGPLSGLKNDQNVRKSNSNNSLVKNNKQKQQQIIKSSSQLQLQKRNKSASVSKGKYTNKRPQQNFISKNDKNQKYFKAIHNTQNSKRSFQPFFDSQNNSSIRQRPDDYFINDLRKQKPAGNYHSPVKNQLDAKKNPFSHSVYSKSFKKSPYQMSFEQKFLINKYHPKQLSPDQRVGLKDKYQLLQKRLGNILQSVKKEKQSMSRSYLDHNKSIYHQVERPAPKVSEGVILYQKLSPLKKLLKMNKYSKMRCQSDF